MLKRISAITICLALLVSLSSFGAASSTDTIPNYQSSIERFAGKQTGGDFILAASESSAYQGASSWAIPELNKASEYGLITDRIRNNMSANITREEFAEIAVKLYEKFTGKKAQAGNATFNDTLNPEIYKAANLGLTSGIGNGNFGPNQLVTREQMATILLRALKVINPNEDYSADTDTFFSDDFLIDSWAQEGVYYCSKVGIIKGILNKETGFYRFDPNGNSSREVAVIVCTRAYEVFTANNRELAFGNNSTDDKEAESDDADEKQQDDEVSVNPDENQPEDEEIIDPDENQPGREEPTEPGDTPQGKETPVTPSDNQNAADTGSWNGKILILESEFKQDDYIITEVNGQSYIFLPYDRFKYVFKMPAAAYTYPEVTNKNGRITTGWMNDQGDTTVEVVMELDNPIAWLNGEEVDIYAGPFQKGDTIYVPVNLFFSMFDMKSEVFQGRWCFQYPSDFPQEVLLGTWGYTYTSIFTGYKDLVTGLVSLPAFDWSYTFNADGTYHMGAVSTGGYQSSLLLQTGKYKVIGNVIIYYDVYETLYKGNPLILQYEKRFMGDRLEYSFIDDYNEEEDKIELDLKWMHR